MRIPKAGQLLACAVVILLSVLVVTQIGGFCRAQTQEGLVVDNAYPLAVTTFKGQQVNTIDGIKRECYDAYIEPNIGNDVMQNVKRARCF